jgi:hypothetical protein
VPVWHASVSYQAPTGPIRLEQLARPALALVERSARQLVAGVGTGDRLWQRGSLQAPHVLHVRRRLSDTELTKLPTGPPPIDRAGGGAPWRPRTTRP